VEINFLESSNIVFAKPTNSSVDLSEQTEIIDIIRSYMETTEFQQGLHNYLKSEQFQLIINTNVNNLIEFNREFIPFDKDLVSQALTHPSLILTIFDDEQIKILIDQLLSFSQITNDQYNALINNPTIITQYHDELLFVLEKHFNFKSHIPLMDDLLENGLDSSIIKVVQDNPSLVINNDLIYNITRDFLNDLFSEHKFLDFDKAEMILRFPQNILQIIPMDEMIHLLHMVQPFLEFISDDKIQLVLNKQLTNDSTIIDVFSTNEIKQIITKHTEIKYWVLRALDVRSVQKLFDSLSDQLLSVDMVDIINNILNNMGYEKVTITKEMVTNWINEVKEQYE